MPHARQLIREAAATALTGLATTGSRVFQSRVYPLKDADLPCLLVNTDEEDITSDSIGPLLLDRSLRLTVRCVAKATANMDDTLDTMIAEVEAVLNGSSLGGKAKQILPASIRVQMEGDQDKPVGVAEIGFSVSYYTAGSDPATPI